MSLLRRAKNLLNRLRITLRQRIGLDRPWHQDLCDYYDVTPQQALALGKRSAGRRPDLPGSATTHAVSGQSFEDIWSASKRDTVAGIFSFYQEAGAWLSFRQIVHNRFQMFPEIVSQVKANMHVCEYGAGVAPVSGRIIEHWHNLPLQLTIADVPSEHLTFGGWRLQRRLECLHSRIKFQVSEVLPDQLPLTEMYDMITILEVYEHLPNPLEVTIHLCDHLKAGGIFWENYIVNTPDFADLPAAQEERSQVFAYLRQHCTLVSGAIPETEGGGGTRCWHRL